MIAAKSSRTGAPFSDVGFARRPGAARLALESPFVARPSGALRALVLSPGDFAWREELRQLNWTAIALAFAIIGLDLGFILLYRTGFEVSLGALVTQTAAAMLLVGIGVLVFRERLSLANGVGIVLCLAGLWLVNRR